MHLKSPSEGPLQAVHHLTNRNCNLAKALPAFQSGSDLYPFTTTTNEITAYTDRLTIENVAALNNVHINHTNELQWSFNPAQPVNINKMLTQLQVSRPVVYSSDNGNSPISLSSQDEEEPQEFDSSSSASSDENNDTEMAQPVKGFVNPNYPGFQHLAHTLDFDENQLNNNDNFDSVSVTMSCVEENKPKSKDVAIELREKPALVFKPERRTAKVPSYLPLNHVIAPLEAVMSPIESKLADATLSDYQEEICQLPATLAVKSSSISNDLKCQLIEQSQQQLSKTKEEISINCYEKDEDSRSAVLKERGSDLKRRRDDKKENARNSSNNTTQRLGEFDIYTIETAMPHIDLEAIECHLKAAKEEEQRRRTDREEIRRRLAMGNEDDYYMDRPGRKPSLQSRLQSGMNLQICFMNETASDNESPSSDNECPLTNPKPAKTLKHSDFKEKPAQRPATLALQAFEQNSQLHPGCFGTTENDFFSKQARLQTEARMALAQAKQMARMQMEIEKQKQKKSPITEMVRHSLEKVGIPFPENKRRLSRQILTEMNVAQLQVIVNDLHTQIETLNEQLVKSLMTRDDLHMEQDSMLVDIEDLTRYLGAKEQVLKQNNVDNGNNNQQRPISPSTAGGGGFKPHLDRIASLVKK